MGYKYHGLHPKVMRWNRQLGYYLRITDRNKALEAESYIINDADFLQHIKDARKSLGLGKLTASDDRNIYEWFDKAMHTIGSSRDFGDLAQTASDTAVSLSLPYGWTDYLAAFIVMNEKPLTVKIQPDLKIDIESIDHTDSLIIRIDKGLTRQDFKKAWKVFDNYFKELEPEPETLEKLKYRIFIDRTKNGMSYGSLAKKYFPNEVNRGIPERKAANDKIKKIIRRIKSGPNGDI